VINVGSLVGVPDGGNPHRWYAPGDVEKVADAITADLKKIDPNDATYFDAQRAAFESNGLAKYHSLISEIRAKYAGVKVGASESILAPLSQALGLDLVTPPSFLKAISEGTDPAPADKSTIDRQISGRQIKAYVYNTQNSTPDVAAQVAAAKSSGIPVVGVTETLSPAGATFQSWQVAQLEALLAALRQATGR
jgi:zinc/manganese transport system substrate-binding protein